MQRLGCKVRRPTPGSLGTETEQSADSEYELYFFDEGREKLAKVILIFGWDFHCLSGPGTSRNLLVSMFETCLSGIV